MQHIQIMSDPGKDTKCYINVLSVISEEIRAMSNTILQDCYLQRPTQYYFVRVPRPILKMKGRDNSRNFTDNMQQAEWRKCSFYYLPSETKAWFLITC